MNTEQLNKYGKKGIKAFTDCSDFFKWDPRDNGWLLDSFQPMKKEGVQVLVSKRYLRSQIKHFNAGSARETLEKLTGFSFIR